MRVRMKVIREEKRDKVMGMRVTLTGEPLKLEVQEALDIPVHLSFPTCGPSMISY